MTKKQKSIKGTRTELNIVLAYLSESAAYTRYTYYARQAEKESYFPVSEIFKETAANEMRHSKVFFKMLEGGNVTIEIDAEAGVIGTTAENLATAMAGEYTEGVKQYKHAAEVAREEGFDEIAEHFEAIAEIELHHHKRFERYLKMVKDGTLWKRDKPVRWRCLVCGYESTGTEPPKTCPACDHPYQHYMAVDDCDCDCDCGCDC